jgi:hypothetical protein
MRLIRQGVLLQRLPKTLELVQLPTFEGIENKMPLVLSLKLSFLLKAGGLEKTTYCLLRRQEKSIRGAILCTDPIEASQTGVNRAIKLEFEDVNS